MAAKNTRKKFLLLGRGGGISGVTRRRNAGETVEKRFPLPLGLASTPLKAGC